MATIYASILRIFIASLWTIAWSSKVFDDSVMFQINWPGDVDAPDRLMDRFDQNLLTDEEAVMMTSGDNEEFLCALPNMNTKDEEKILEYQGSTPRELLQPLYKQRSCTYRIEMYWTYELCHGRYLMQYHEEKDSARRTKRQEYYLGQYIVDTINEEEVNFDHLNPPKRKVEDQMLAYYPVRYIQGTVCDITNRPRVTEVHYVCVPESKNQIYSFDEVSSCEYELVVLTPRLCSHPAFQIEENPINPVTCYPLEGSPPRPAAMTAWEREQQWETKQYQRQNILGRREKTSGFESQGNNAPAVTPTPVASPATTPVPRQPIADSALVKSFLAGDYCLYGGAGWWKHEYCHGRQVLQFHEDQEKGVRSEIILGKWNKDVHLKWIADKPHKGPLKVDGMVRQVSHYYTGGDYCDLTKSFRVVEVRLRCRETQGNSNAVTLYLLEPKPCEYILGVESQMFCDLLQTANEQGLLEEKEDFP